MLPRSLPPFFSLGLSISFLSFPPSSSLFLACHPLTLAPPTDAAPLDAPAPPSSQSVTPQLTSPTTDAAASLAVPPAPPLPPPVAASLFSDLQHRLASAASTLTLPPGPGPGPRVRTAAGTFVLVAADPAVPLDRAVTLTELTTAALFAGPLAHRPEQAVTVFLFSTQAPYDRALHARVAAAPQGEIGHYHAATREIFVSLAAASIDTLSHEVTHPLLDADYPHAPAWLVEGIASLFEAPDFSVPGEIHGKAHFRLQTLRDALASPATRPLVRIDALFGMSDQTFRKEKPWLKYAMAREAMRWLDGEKHALWAFYRAWRDGVLEDATGEKAFAAAVGETPVAAQEEWLQWIVSERAER